MRRIACLMSAVLLLLGLAVMQTPAQAAVSTAKPTITPSMPAGLYRGVALTRVLNTAMGVGAHKVAAGATARFEVAGVGAVPANVEAVVIDVAVLNPTQSGAVAVFPGGTTWNGMETISFNAGQTEQSMLTQKLGSDGTLSIRNNLKVPVDLLGDVTGYYTGGTTTVPGSYVPLSTPKRIGDTHLNPIPAVGRRTITGFSGLSSDPISAVVVNLTVITPAKDTRVTVVGNPTSFYNDAAIYVPAGRTQQRMATESPDSNGALTVCFLNCGTPLTILIDVVGYFRAGTVTDRGGYKTVTATRVFDTRDKANVPVQPGRSVYFYVGSLPGVGAAQLDISIVRPTVRGSVSVLAGTTTPTGAATISYPVGQVYVRPVTVTVGVDHAVQVHNNSSAPVTVMVDEFGTLLGAPSPVAAFSDRLADPTQGNAIGLSCPTTSFCAALQDNGFVTTYDGTSWGKATRLAGMSLDRAANIGAPLTGTWALTCASATFCVAVGNHLATFDGTSWTVSQDSPVLGLTSVSCPTSTFCVAVSRDGSAYHWDGSSWTKLATTIFGDADHNVEVSCVSATYCLAVAPSSAAIWNGSRWARGASDGAPITHPASLSCATPSFCVAVDANGGTIKWSGGAWTRLSGGSYSGSVSCPTPDFCMVAGNISSFEGYGDIATLSAGATSWSSPIKDTGYYEDAVSCLSATNCVVLSGYGEATALHWNGVTFGADEVVDPGHGYPTGISCPEDGRCVAVDFEGWYFTLDQTGWSSPQRLPQALKANQVSCSSINFCLATDAAGATAVFNGTTWSSVTGIGSGHTLRELTCGSSTSCVAVQDDSVLRRWDGTAWTAAIPMPGGGDANSVSCPSANFCMAAGTTGNVTRWNGVSWSAASPIAETGRGSCGFGPSKCNVVSCSSASYCLATGYDSVPASPAGTVYRAAQWNGSSWQLIPTGPTDPEGAFDCGADDRCAAVGFDVSGWSGTEWVQHSSWWTNGLSQQRVSCADATFCGVVNGDGQGAIAHLSW